MKLFTYSTQVFQAKDYHLGLANQNENQVESVNVKCVSY